MKEIALIIHFIGLAMGLGTSFAFLFLGIAARKMEANAGRTFMLNTYSLSRMGYIGLTLLIVSGLYMMTPYWKMLGSMPLLMTKLILVLALGALLGIMGSTMKKIKNGGPEAESLSLRMQRLGPITLLLTLTIITLAVLIFK
ncbi:MAG: hypothetical protein ABI844_02755 [Saprospiraceae bacterium]